MHLLGCLVFFIFGALFVLMAVIGAAGEALRRVLFGPRPDAASRGGARRQTERPRDGEKKSRSQKIFGKTDGEYVDFEEIP